jgi:DNA uptake protein ComE-like DNA-binding protein
MKPATLIKDYFTFNRKEQRGIFVLITILLLLVTANQFVPMLIRPGPVDFSGFEKEIAAFEKEVARADSIAEHEKRNRYQGPGYRTSTGIRDSIKLPKSYPKEIFTIELNSTDTFELQRLRGIGSSFARRIVKYRDRLGGFISKSQLLEVWGMDSSRYNAIAEHLYADPDSIHKIDLNTVSFKELLSHPYFPFEVTKAIMLYRKEHKKFMQPEELMNIKVIPDSAYRKMKDYIRVGL